MTTAARKFKNTGKIVSVTDKLEKSAITLFMQGMIHPPPLIGLRGAIKKTYQTLDIVQTWGEDCPPHAEKWTVNPDGPSMVQIDKGGVQNSYLKWKCKGLDFNSANHKGKSGDLTIVLTNQRPGYIWFLLIDL